MRSSEYNNGSQQYGEDTTSHEYHDYVSRVARMPSVTPDVPRYPNVYMIFNNKHNYNQEQQQHEEERENIQHVQSHQNIQHAPEARKKVQFVEKTTEVDNSNGNAEVYDKTVDTEADGFIQQRHKNFEFFKWTTFKAR